MKLADLSPAMLAGRLDAGLLLLTMGPFVARLRSPLPGLARDLARVYRDFDLAPQDGFADFHVDLLPERGPQRWLRPQAATCRVYLDGQPSPVTGPAAASGGLSLLEDGLNWCITSLAHQFLVLHAAVVERGGCAVLLPGSAGAGKSTLCAALVQQGWRLLSDELALVDLDSGLVHGMARPIGLRNGAIAALRRFAPAIPLTTQAPEGRDPTLALARPPTDSVARMREPAWPGWLVLPRFDAAGPPAELAPHGAAATFMQLAAESFNYRVHGVRGFEALGELIDQCSCHLLHYARLDAAVQVIDALAATPPCPAVRDF